MLGGGQGIPLRRAATLGAGDTGEGPHYLSKHKLALCAPKEPAHFRRATYDTLQWAWGKGMEAPLRCRTRIKKLRRPVMKLRLPTRIPRGKEAQRLH